MSQKYSSDQKTDSTTTLVLPQLFLSPSVTGFILSRPSAEIVEAANESSWKSSIPGSLSVLEWE